jgi:hypothetical protein
MFNNEVEYSAEGVCHKKSAWFHLYKIQENAQFISNDSYLRGRDQEDQVETSLGQKKKKVWPISKIPNTKKIWLVVQVECLPKEHEPLN